MEDKGNPEEGDLEKVDCCTGWGGICVGEFDDRSFWDGVMAVLILGVRSDSLDGVGLLSLLQRIAMRREG
jgi:hypothetical protein